MPVSTLHPTTSHSDTSLKKSNTLHATPTRQFDACKTQTSNKNTQRLLQTIAVKHNFNESISKNNTIPNIVWHEDIYG